MTPEEAVAKLDAITGDNEKYAWSVGEPGRLNPERAHVAADYVLGEFVVSVAPEVVKAYNRVIQRADDWWYS